MSKKSNLLGGKLFCISVNNGSANEEKPGADLSNDATKASYNDVKQIVEQLGGKISPTVHKRVDFMVATDSAVTTATQRIRKAHKFGIPVLRMEYIEFCTQHKKLPSDITPYVYNNIEEMVEKYKEAVATATALGKRKTCDTRTDTPNSDSHIPNISRDDLVFECSCICHDRGEVSCSWCVDAHTSQQSTCDENSVTRKKSKSSKKVKRKKR